MSGLLKLSASLLPRSLPGAATLVRVPELALAIRTIEVAAGFSPRGERRCRPRFPHEKTIGREGRLPGARARRDPATPNS